MLIYVDGDACPVVNEVIETAAQFSLKVVIVKSYAHYSITAYPEHVKEVYLDRSREAVDYRILSLMDKGDIVVTQDYGLAALVLQKSGHAISPRGFQYNQDNIERLLASRHQSAQIRRQGGRTKGPKPFSNTDKTQFIMQFTKLIQSL